VLHDKKGRRTPPPQNVFVSMPGEPGAEVLDVFPLFRSPSSTVEIWGDANCGQAVDASLPIWPYSTVSMTEIKDPWRQAAKTSRRA